MYQKHSSIFKKTARCRVDSRDIAIPKIPIIKRAKLKFLNTDHPETDKNKNNKIFKYRQAGLTQHITINYIHLNAHKTHHDVVALHLSLLLGEFLHLQLNTGQNKQEIARVS